MPIVKKPAAGWKFKRATNASRGNAARRVPEAPGDQPEQAAPGHPHPGNADTALRLGRYFDMSPQFWLNLQQTYDLSKSDGRAGEENCSRGPGLRCSQHGQARSRSQP
jgi:hypothetical protein